MEIPLVMVMPNIDTQIVPETAMMQYTPGDERCWLAWQLKVYRSAAKVKVLGATRAQIRLISEDNGYSLR